MDKLLPTVLTIVIIAAIFGLIFLGWRGRLRRQAGIDPLPEIPADRGPVLLEAQGQYVATTTAGDWLDRLAVHQLGLRTNAVLQVSAAGVLIRRSGAADLWIRAAALTEVSTTSGMAGKFVERDGLLVLSWLLGPTPVDTGFRTREAAAKTPLLDALRSLAAGNATSFPTEGTEHHD